VLVRDPEAARSIGVELPVAGDELLVGPRIGITKAMELAWRFGVRGSAGLSRGF
jgi:DNA-3-methyladenine glycosylase